MSKHIDGLTGQEFATEEEYLNHTSAVTGFKPTDPRHHGERFLLQSKEALKRTGSLDPTKEKAIDSQLVEIKSADIDGKISKERAVSKSGKFATLAVASKKVKPVSI